MTGIAGICQFGFRRRAIAAIALFTLLSTTVAMGQTARRFRDRTNGRAVPVSSSVLNGIVTDTMCRASKHDPSRANAADCIRHCAQTGSKYALVSGGKVYTLRGDGKDFAKFAGQEVSVQGTLNLYELTVESIMPASATAEKQ